MNKITLGFFLAKSKMTVKRLLLLFVLLLMNTQASWGQTINEDFASGTLGNTITVSPISWSSNGTGNGTFLIANSTPLTSTNYNGGGGNYISVTKSTSGTSNVGKIVTGITSGTNTFYTSFLLNVNAVGTGYFGAITTTINSGTNNSRIYMQSATGGYNLGIAKSSGTATYGATVLTTGTTYLIVLKYVYSTGTTTDDQVYLWVNPIISAEPSTSSSEVKDITTIDASAMTSSSFGFTLRNPTTSPNYSFDGLKVAYGTTSALAWTNLAAVSSVSTPTLTTPTASSITDVSATLGATVTVDGGASLTARGTVYKTTSGVIATDNALAEGATTVSAFSHSRTSLTPQTQYFYKGYATNSAGTGLSPEGSFRTLSSAPTAQASGLSGTGFSTTQVDLTIGTAATFPASNATQGGYVVIYATGTPTFTATNGFAPSAGVGTIFTTTATVLPATPATAINVTGLAAATSYNFLVVPYTWDGTNVSTYNYLTASAPTTTASTTAGATVDWCNIQWPNTTQNILEGTSLDVYAKVYEPGITNAGGKGANINAWVGYSATNQNPNTGSWTWVAAAYNADAGSDDEYKATLSGITPGTYYYASRFQIGTGLYTYGGTNGVWNNDSVTLNVASNIVDYCNVQSPASGTITVGGAFDVYTQVYEPGITDAGGQGAGISAELGYSLTNTNPNSVSGWTWVISTYNTDSGNNDEYKTEIGSALAIGTYYYASRFKKTGSTEYVYGGTAGIWNNNSGVLTVNTPQNINVQGNSVTIVDGDTTPSLTDDTNFSSVALGSSIVKTFTIQNTGGTNLVLGSPVSLSEIDGFSISAQPTSPVLPNGGSTTFQITFTPTIGGADSNTISIANNDPDVSASVYTFDVTANATINTPVAVAATNLTQTSFNANWGAVTGANYGYLLDVGTSASFGLASDLFFSEYVEGSSNNKAIEIYNGTGASVNLSNYTIKKQVNGLGVFGSDLVLSGVLPNGATYVIANSSSSAQILALANLSTTSGSFTFNGNDAVALYNNGTQIDVVGVVDQVASWGADVTLRRKSTIINPTIAYSLADWDSLANDTYSNLGSHTFSSTPSFVTGYNAKPIAGQATVTSLVDTNLTENTTYYYRVRAVNGSVISANSNTISLTTKPASVTWNGAAWSNTTGPDTTIEAIIDAIYNTNVGGVQGPFTAKKLTVNASKSLTINSGTNLTVVNEVINNGSLVVENNANLIQDPATTTNSNVGVITVKRNSNPLYRLDYTSWSSPVLGAQTLADFSPLTSQSPNRFYIYDNTLGANGLYASVPPATPFATGTGYLIRMPNEDPSNLGVLSDYYLGTGTTPTITYNGVFTGTPNNGNIPVTLNYGVDAAHAYNLVGNPYPSVIDANTFITANTANIESTLYFWRKTNGSGTAYAAYNPAGGVSTYASSTSELPNGKIQVGQGFLVQAKSAITVPAFFTNAMRDVSPTSTQFFKTKQVAQKDRVWLNLTNTTGVFSQALIAYIADATPRVDIYDGKYINDSPIALTSNINNEEYTIQGRPTFDATDVVALNFKTDVAGDYTIAIDHSEGVFASGQDIYLVDSKTGAETNLKTSSYNFTAASGIDNTRFSLKYQKTLKVDDVIFNENNVTVYAKNGSLYVNSGEMAISTIQVYDVQGRLIAERKNVKATTATLDNLKANNQVLLVKVVGENNQAVTKKVVN